MTSKRVITFASMNNTEFSLNLAVHRNIAPWKYEPDTFIEANLIY